ncbi:MAG TPA: poly-gamma-glutamate system protein [candidate division Zixibacteria bacterium]|nr:poly-gamma-glutamate system protein [candidate division Zixibacteria bacterium]
MKWRSRRVSLGALVFLALFGIAVMATVELSKVRLRKPHFDEKVTASNLTMRAFSAVKNHAGETLVKDPIADPNSTGLIGDQFTIITTDRGDLGAKLTTTNPNWGAVVVDMLSEAGARREDYVAVAYTGSMPALNIAVLCAIETIGATPVIISSVGASMWGANNPEFAWPDMESVLFENGIIKHRSTSASLGGRGDAGGNVSPEGRAKLREIIERNGIDLIEAPTLDEAIDRRMEIYGSALPEGARYSAFVNVGGGLASIGSSQNLVAVRPGLNMTIPRGNFPRKGAMIRFAERGVPVINLSEVNEIARRYGLPVSPMPLPDVPHGDVYSELRYRLWLTVLVLAIYLAMVFVVIRVDLTSVIFPRKGRNGE